MKHVQKVIVISCIILGLFMVGCTPSETSCEIDKDCVPSSCCHAESAVNKEFAPNCQSVLCSMECKPDTLDCAQGKIKCIENTCKVILN